VTGTIVVPDMVKSFFQINRKFVKCFLIISIIFIFDRITKIYILEIAENTGSVDIYVNQFLNFILIWNDGIGFGLLSSKNNLFYNSITVLIIFINFLLIYLTIKANNFNLYFLLMVVGGSLGNLFDRIYYSAVPDFIDVNFNGYHWFVFNIADMFITIGVLCLIFAEIFLKDKYYKSNV